MVTKTKKIFIIVGIILLISIGLIFFNFHTGKIISSEIKASTIELSKLVLNISELPEEHNIAERAPRLKSDVVENAIDLGWKEGYYIRYVKGDLEENLFDTSRIDIAVSKYPLENISKTLDDSINNFNLEGYSSEKLPIANLGNNSRGSRYTEEISGLRMYRIEFIKKDIYVNQIMSGISTYYELLEELARKIEIKI